MPRNTNPWVTQLLSWHGHDRGGVHVPFQTQSNPLGVVIETTLIERLRLLAKSIAANDIKAPRWIFLIGGPGNGKSETVADFLSSLDEELNLSGSLVQVLAQAFAPEPLVRRRVEVISDDLAGSPESFANRVGRLLVIQDATATENALGNAALELADDIADLLTSSGTPLPVFIACANRGLLARALKEASQVWGPENDVTRLLSELIRASSLSTEALARQPSSCWPLDSNMRAACWPLDLESLLVEHEGRTAPADQIITTAIQEDKWELDGRCADCDSASLCPLRQNAIWLRDSGHRQALITILRHGELHSGQRWNFRSAFSLVAEVVVGQWSDFEPASHPCDWVHQAVSQLTDQYVTSEVAPAYSLVRRLYPHALFSTNFMQQVAEQYGEEVNWEDQELSRTTIELLSTNMASSVKPIREVLLRSYVKLDPAVFTPRNADHRLRHIEDTFSQSVVLGKAALGAPGLAAAEERLLTFLERAESEWDLLARNAYQAQKILYLLRRFASIMCKRSVGARLGHHANEEVLSEFKASIRDTTRLNQIKDVLQSLLGEDGLEFNMLESFGQPQADENRLVTLQGDRPGLRAFAAPVGSSSRPGHDVPCFEITGSGYRIPITFDFFLALRLRKEGCASSSLPASVRAAIDRVRHRYAGTLSRNTEKFADGTARIVIANQAAIVLADENASPSLTDL